MPPAAEPIHNRVVAALVANLASMVAGSTYWHSTGRAVPDSLLRAGHFDSSLRADQAHYVVIHDQDEDGWDSATDFSVRVEVDVAAFRRFAPTVEKPYVATAPVRSDVEGRLAADVKNRLRSDEGIAAIAAIPGVGSVRVSIPFTHFTAAETIFEGFQPWAVVMLRVVVELSQDGTVAA